MEIEAGDMLLKIVKAGDGNYQIVVIADGYQAYRSSVMEVTNGHINSQISMIEARPAPSNINIGVGDGGFEQSILEVEQGWVVKFINTGTSQHGAASSELGESSGLLDPGESFKMAFPTEGTFEITDPANSGATLVVQVVGSGPSDPSGSSKIFLPIIIR